MNEKLTKLALQLGVLAVFFAALSYLPGRRRIASQVIGDNVYIYQSADRLFEGRGLTSVPPVAPLQPWEYQRDWAWLTQWPMGYPLLLCGLRYVFGIGSIQAGQWLSLAACAIALTGWFGWLRRVAPPGVAGTLLAIVGATTAVNAASLIDPSTDTLLTAWLPWVLLATDRLCRVQDRQENQTRFPVALAWLGLGLLCGLLVWIRYAAIFVAVGIGAYLVVRRWLQLTSIRQLASFAVGAALPIGLLVAINSYMSRTTDLQSQMNLGATVGFDFSFSMLTTTWWLWTDLPFYEYKWYSHWFFAAIVPLIPMILYCVSHSYRARLATWLRKPSVALSAGVAVSLVAMLVVSTTFFKDKYNFISLNRYYRPIQPLYFALVVAPLLEFRQRIGRVLVTVALLFALYWSLCYEWPRPYNRWLSTRTQRTRYGRLAVAFSPQAIEMFDWVGTLNPRREIVFSNFQDEIALETGVAALPLPKSKQQFDRWMAHVTAQRGLDRATVRAVFVIDADYHNREYYLPALADLKRTLSLTPDPKAPQFIQPFVYIAAYQPPPES